MGLVIDIATARRKRATTRAPKFARSSIEFVRLPTGAYQVIYRGDYASSNELAIAHLSDAIHQLAREIDQG